MIQVGVLEVDDFGCGTIAVDRNGFSLDDGCIGYINGQLQRHREMGETAANVVLQRIPVTGLIMDVESQIRLQLTQVSKAEGRGILQQLLEETK